MSLAEATENKDILRQVDFFTGAADAVLEEFARACVRETLPAGRVILEKNAPGHSLYIVIEGRAEVHDEELTLAILGPRESFGELSTLENGLCSVSVTAETALEVLRLDRESILEIMAAKPEAGTLLMQSLCRVLRKRSEQVVEGAYQRRTLQRELEIGRKIQAGFLPPSLPAEDGWEIGAYFHAAREVAGDFYDAFRIGTVGRTALVIGDVCDKGVGAALFMTLFRSLIRASATSKEFAVDALFSGDTGQDRAAQLLRNSIGFANDYIARTHGDTSMFATIFFGLLDPLSGHLYYINGGHEEPLILADGKIKAELGNTGPAVGLFPEASFGIGEAVIEPGQTLFAYTDGATDALSAGGEAFGRAGLDRHIAESGLQAEGLVASVAAAVDRHAHGRAQYDDLTLLAVTRKPPA